MRICFVCLNAYSALNRDSGVRHVGGAETQTLSIAKGLAARGHMVSLITLDHGQPEGINVQGLVVHKAFRQEEGLPGLRFIWPRMTSVWKALSRANARVVVQPCADSFTGVAACWCRWHRRRLAWLAMNDLDCDASLPLLTTRRERVLFRYGLRRADARILQTETQRHMLERNFHTSGSVIRPCHSDVSPASDVALGTSTPDGKPRPSVLWIGRFVPDKCLEWCLEIAEACPEVTFHVVGGSNMPTGYAAELQRRATQVKNVVLHGCVAYAEMGALYRLASLVLVTSRAEGFPTVFLEAWSCGVPVVTTFDPDNLVVDRGLGWVGSNVDELAGQVRAALASPQMWCAASARAQAYYRANHTLEAVIPQFESVLQGLAGCGGPSELP